MRCVRGITFRFRFSPGFSLDFGLLNFYLQLRSEPFGHLRLARMKNPASVFGIKEQLCLKEFPSGLRAFEPAEVNLHRSEAGLLDALALIRHQTVENCDFHNDIATIEFSKQVGGHILDSFS